MTAESISRSPDTRIEKIGQHLPEYRPRRRV